MPKQNIEHGVWNPKQALPARKSLPCKSQHVHFDTNQLDTDFSREQPLRQNTFDAFNGYRIKQYVKLEHLAVNMAEPYSSNSFEYHSSSANNEEENVNTNVKTFEELTGGLPPESTQDRTNHTLFLKDGKRKIDLVLVYDDEDLQKGVLNQMETLRILHRIKFEENLCKEGLELETEMKEASYDQKTCFVKVHVPYRLVKKYAAIMHIKRPIKRFLSISVNAWEGEEDKPKEYNTVCFPIGRLFRLNSETVENDPVLYTSIFGHDHEDQLLVKDREGYFTSAQRSQIAWHILLKTKFGDDNNFVGIRKLLNSGAYLSVFPLHEGNHDRDSDSGVVYDRRKLYLEWANPTRWYKNQPLWLVRKYFGDKIALYFAWLGFYTNMLILPSIVGLCCFIYGLSTMDSPHNIPSKEICDNNVAGNITLCPLCDTSCRYQKLGDSCLFSNMTYLVDNSSTVFFSVFMSFWATSFLEMWKRRQAVIAWQWDLHLMVDDDETRPEYDMSANMFRINPVTRRKEPFVPTWKKMLRVSISVATVLSMIILVLCAVVTTIIFRLMLFTIINDSDHIYVKTHSKIITSILAALLNLVIIMILTKIYHYVALWLTHKENPRTNTDYEKSFIVKIFLFEFMNYYSTLIYIAFFKGRFFTHPADADSGNSLLLRLKRDICDPAGCITELCIQLAIIMIGKQCFNNMLELGFPAIRNWWRNRAHKIATKDPNWKYTHWEENYNLQDPGMLALFEEYLEMVIQYGFVTLFVAAFPLAPLFALLNNICEIRLDAYKMVAQARRPLAERVENIGAWFTVLRGITYCAVIFNAFVIAYTSDYIPRKMYQYFYSQNYDLIGYIDSSLSVFNTSDYPRDTKYNKLGKGMQTEPDTCQYRGYRNGPNDTHDPYGLSLQYWHVFAARLIFVIVFEHFVFTVTGVIANVIPNVPYQVSRQIQLEKLLNKETGNATKDEDVENNQQQSDEYDELLSAIREARNSAKLSAIVQKKNVVRKVSRHSVVNIQRKSQDLADELNDSTPSTECETKF